MARRMRRAVIVGAGGFGREIAEQLADLPPDHDVTIGGFLDDNPGALNGLPEGLPLLGAIDSYPLGPQDHLIIAVGDPSLRSILAARLKDRGARFMTLVHPTAVVARTARLATGCVVGPHAYVGPHTHLGEMAVVNIYGSLGHDARIGDFSVLSPYATLNGGALLEREVFLGTHSTITGGRRVGERAKVAAGAVVYQDVEPRALAAGNPARAHILYR